MKKIRLGHCRVAHIGNDSLKMKTVVIANDKGITKIFGVDPDIRWRKPDTVTAEDFCRTERR